MSVGHAEQGDREMRKVVSLTVYAPAELRRAAKVYAAQHGTTVSALVIKLLTEHLSRESSG